MKKWLLSIYLLGICALSADLYQWNAITDIDEVEAGFIRSFTNCYRNIPLEVLKIDDLQTFLKNAFQDELEAYSKKDPDVLQLTVTREGYFIGFGSFWIGNYPNEVYIRQLFVDPFFQRKGVGRKMVFEILSILPKTKKIILITRKINKQAIDFYTNLGFTICSYMHEGYDPEVYIGLEFENET